MRTKSVELKEESDFVEVAVTVVELLADDQREELEQLRAERDARVKTEEAQLKALELNAVF